MESESSQEIEDLWVEQMSKEFNAPVSLVFDEENGVYVASAMAGEQPLCQGRGITAHMALRNLRQSFDILNRSKGATS